VGQLAMAENWMGRQEAEVEILRFAQHGRLFVCAALAAVARRHPGKHYIIG